MPSRLEPAIHGGSGSGVSPLKGLKFENGAYPALRFPSSPNSGEPGTPLRAGLSCRRPALRDLIDGTPNLSADLVIAGCGPEVKATILYAQNVRSSVRY